MTTIRNLKISVNICWLVIFLKSLWWDRKECRELVVNNAHLPLTEYNTDRNYTTNIKALAKATKETMYLFFLKRRLIMLLSWSVRLQTLVKMYVSLLLATLSPQLRKQYILVQFFCFVCQFISPRSLPHWSTLHHRLYIYILNSIYCTVLLQFTVLSTLLQIPLVRLHYSTAVEGCLMTL